MEFGPILRSIRRNKVRYGLIVAEVALTLAVVANCVHMIREARREMAIASGFDDENLIRVTSTPFAEAFREQGYRDNSREMDLQALSKMPGVRAASNTGFLPWQGGGSSMETRPLGSKGEMLRNQVYSIDESTLATLGAQLVEGRNFTREQVRSDAERLRALYASNRAVGPDGLPQEKFTQDVIVSKAFAKLLFKDGQALGKRLEDTDGDQYRVIGVVDRFYNPYGWPIHEYVMFFANYGGSFDYGTPYLVRAEPGRKESVRAGIEKTLLAVNNGRNLTVKSIPEIKEQFQAGTALLVRILSLVIFLLIFVTSLGIVGLTTFSVAERTRQIGTRRALGAQKKDILRYFLLENWIVTTMGLAFGVLLAYGLNVVLVSKLGAVKMPAGLVLAGVLFLWLAGLLATFFPALRGSRVAPAIATRNV